MLEQFIREPTALVYYDRDHRSPPTPRSRCRTRTKVSYCLHRLLFIWPLYVSLRMGYVLADNRSVRRRRRRRPPIGGCAIEHRFVPWKAWVAVLLGAHSHVWTALSQRTRGCPACDPGSLFPPFGKKKHLKTIHQPNNELVGFRRPWCL
jgi:hypothetical protein